MSKSKRLLLFAKIPTPGQVKTRLCPPLCPDQAAELYEAFLRDILEQSQALSKEGIALELHFCGGEERELPSWVRESEGLVCHVQVGEDLGERMRHAFGRAFATGASAVVLRNTDSPLLPADRIREAFESAEAPGIDLVLGPDLGGGYYLVGLDRPLQGLFDLEALDSHTEGQTVLAASRAWALQEGLSLCLLREEGDVDEPTDLERLRAQSASDLARAPHTARVLAGLDGKSPMR
jgi:uncharacterized protein